MTVIFSTYHSIDVIKKSQFNYDLDEVDPYISQINHFIDVINKKVNPITNASDAKRTLKVALSILESAKLSSIIKIWS